LPASGHISANDDEGRGIRGASASHRGRESPRRGPPRPSTLALAETELDFIRTISPRDRMVRRSTAEHYFRVGLEALQYIQVAVVAAGTGAPNRILDLPCGHGRVLRMLRAAFPKA
jgi:hypothetical protein